jgi:hypothetical protein
MTGQVFCPVDTVEKYLCLNRSHQSQARLAACRRKDHRSSFNIACCRTLSFNYYHSLRHLTQRHCQRPFLCNEFVCKTQNEEKTHTIIDGADSLLSTARSRSGNWHGHPYRVRQPQSSTLDELFILVMVAMPPRTITFLQWRHLIK